MESCDVLIVGGGPAGSSLAWGLRRSGLDAVILDKSAFPREKVCAGWITPAVFKTLQIDPDEYEKGRVLQPFAGFRTGLMDGPVVETRYGGPVSYGIRRYEFDHFLLQRSGARLRLGEPLRTISRRDGFWIVNDSVKTPLLIGAGGHFCPVARYLGERAGKVAQEFTLSEVEGRRGDLGRPFVEQNLVVAQEMELEMDEGQARECQIRPDTPELYFCNDLKGYGWCIRKGNFINIGLGRVDESGTSGHVKAFFDLLRDRGRVPRDLPARFKGHAYLLYGNGSRNVVEDGIMLMGDSAGLASPQSGEGILPAIESGLMGADVILGAEGIYSKDRLSTYPSLLTRRFGNKGAFPFLPGSFKNPVAKRLMASRLFSRHILLDRWFLHQH
jgi:flavin-dependent dehydrogenase